MADNDSTDGKNKIIQTALEPAAKEFAEASKGAGTALGKAAALSAKSVEVLLSPLGLLIYGYEQIRDQFVPEVERKLEGVPEDRRIEPRLLIAGPTIEALRFAGEVPELREMFANLLATAIDADTAKNAHPSFVDIIKQLAPDDARILSFMVDSGYQPLVDIERKKKNASTKRTVIRHFNLLGAHANLEHSELGAQYIDNLCRLGLCEVPDTTSIAASGAYDELEQHPDARKVIAEIAETDAEEGYEGRFNRKFLRFTSLGQQFVRACVEKHDDAILAS